MPEEPIHPHAIRTVFSGRVFTVQVESLALPHGHPLDAEIVRHPRSVVIAPVTDEGGLVLVRQYRHAVGQRLWELPAGSMDPGEGDEEAARRECQEEIGLIPATLERLGALYPTPGYCDEEMVLFRATGLRVPTGGDPAAHPDPDEDIESGAFSLDEVRRMVADGRIRDMKTVAVLAFLVP
ncbi:MAG: NUDIX hydrolase [Acidimicrobiia bacterium]|nr:NUDIX hydrolase [Acidimicrobiia bacterium]